MSMIEDDLKRKKSKEADKAAKEKEKKWVENKSFFQLYNFYI